MESNKSYCPPTAYPPYIEEDEIDLRELFSTIWHNKWKLFFISLLITSLAVIYALITPNSYTSKTILLMKGQSKPSLGGGAAALASLAGISLGGGGGLDLANLFKNLINDYSFNKKLIQKYQLADRLNPENMKQNLVYPLNGQEMAEDIKSILHSKSNKKKPITKEELVFNTFGKLKKIMSVSTDKESGAITLSATLEDRFLAKDLVEIYLKEMSEYARELDMKEIQEQEAYYNHELKKADSLELKQGLADLISTLTQKKVLSQAGEYYMVKQLTPPEVPYIKDKTKPKRALIVIVAFITSIILGIFIIFFINFLKQDKELKKKQDDDLLEEEIELEFDERKSKISF